IYGLGHSEEVVGEALKEFSRDQVIVATKCGRVPDENGAPHANLRPGSMRREIEASLKRLRTDFIDLYQIHWPDTETGTPIEDSWATMVEFQKEGKARYLGVSNFDAPLLETCEAIHHV